MHCTAHLLYALDDAHDQTVRAAYVLRQVLELSKMGA